MVRVLALVLALALGLATGASAVAPRVLTDAELVAVAREVLDVNNQWRQFDLDGKTYRGQRLGVITPFIGPLAIAFFVPPGASCQSIGGIDKTYMLDGRVGRPFHECIPQILDDKGLDQGSVKRGSEFTEDEIASVELQPVFGSAVPLIDADLTDYATAFFIDSALVWGPKTDNGWQNQVTGVYNAVPIEASLGPCQYCQIATNAIYYRTPGSSALCVKIGGRAVLYPLKSTRSRWGRFCVPGLLVDLKAYGQGIIDDGRPGVIDVKSLPAFDFD